MIFLAISLNSEPVKYGLFILLAPYWIPFFKALWKSLNDSLIEEGGLIGREPTEDELKQIHASRHTRPSDLVSESNVRPGDLSGRRRPGARGARGAGGARGARPGSRPRAGGFR